MYIVQTSHVSSLVLLAWQPLKTEELCPQTVWDANHPWWMGLGQQAQNASKCSNGPTKQAWQVSTVNAHLNFKMGKRILKKYLKIF